MPPTEIAATLDRLRHEMAKHGELLGRCAHERGDALTHSLAQLKHSTQKQRDYLEELSAQLDAVSVHEAELRSELLEAHQQLLSRDVEFERSLANLQRSHAAARSVNGRTRRAQKNPEQLLESGYLRYRHMVEQIKATVAANVPKEAVVIVVSRGDAELVRLEGRTGWHFPQTPDGIYAGHYPANAPAAVEHLTALSTRGARFLLLPGTAFWWLDYYKDFAEHLDRRWTRRHGDEHCMLYELLAPAVEEK